MAGTSPRPFVTFIPLRPYHTGYRRCCTLKKNVRGTGEPVPLLSPEEMAARHPAFPYADPYYHLGYRHYRGVACTACGSPVNGHEYLP